MKWGDEAVRRPGPLRNLCTGARAGDAGPQSWAPLGTAIGVTIIRFPLLLGNGGDTSGAEEKEEDGDGRGGGGGEPPEDWRRPHTMAGTLRATFAAGQTRRVVGSSTDPFEAGSALFVISFLVVSALVVVAMEKSTTADAPERRGVERGEDKSNRVICFASGMRGLVSCIDGEVLRSAEKARPAGGGTSFPRPAKSGAAGSADGKPERVNNMLCRRTTGDDTDRGDSFPCGC